MVTNFAFVYCKSIAAGRHELAAFLQELHKLLGIQPLCRASLKPCVGSEFIYNGLYKTFTRCITVASHHLDYFISVYHNLPIFNVNTVEYTDRTIQKILLIVLQKQCRYNIWQTPNGSQDQHLGSFNKILTSPIMNYEL